MLGVEAEVEVDADADAAAEEYFRLNPPNDLDDVYAGGKQVNM